ncbi:PREDICTED: nose resistant to fluoxetine protein 6-like [Nicrophorus vespilloides]|uniref:Nose resistant to fluoxetine protein 6-like n=1 Tax=Nicrophorus vespilloides TaxID=110193 RepID=A0ABM1N7T4_NICVS|nr:PREDICTED: nose resistant to fluoxetine protein 6-like [Nicrophorus vespilloides]
MAMRFVFLISCVLLVGVTVEQTLTLSVNESRPLFSFYPMNILTNGTVVDKVNSFADLEQDLELGNQMKGKLCAKNYTSCMQNDPDYEASLSKVTGRLFANSPPFDLSTLDGVGEECRKDSRRFLDALRTFQMWALQMYDASAKVPSGFLSGNINQLGDFDLCMSSRSMEDRPIYGKYCLPSLQVETPHNAYLSAIHNRLYAHQVLKSKFEDPGHRVPKFSSVNWALCVPHTCTTRDVDIGFRNVVQQIFAGTDFEYKTEMDPQMCSSAKPETNVNYGFIYGTAFFVSVFLVAAAAGLYDYLNGDKPKNDWIMAFSLRRNLQSMLSIEKQANDLEAVHGIRFINALMLIFSHKSMALLFLPYTNRTAMSEIIGQPWTVIGRAASLYTDPFIMLSGTLTAYSLFGRLQKNIRINILEEYASRLFRIVPTLGALILFCTFVLPFIGSGPMWNLVITHHSHICKKNWWRNLMFIHNYFGFKDMCLTHTHHVGIDTQLFFTSPFMVLVLWKWPKKGAFTLATIALISTIMRYYVTYSMKLSNYIHFGTSIEQLFNTADYMYILPPHRLTVYIMGIFLGYLLRNCKNIILKPIQLQFGNVLAIISFVTSFIGPAFMGSINYIYDPVHAAWYASFAPILWCFSFAWIIFTHQNGYKSFISEMFAFRYFKLWTKISYTVYLTQFPIFFYNVGTLRHSEYYQFIPKNLNILELICIFGLSSLLTLLFETPFQNIKNIIFRKKRAPETAKKLS